MNRRDLVRVFWRGLWLQGSWSYRDMQSLGFAWAMEPVLRRRYQGEALQRATAGYLGFFNSNPILAAAILGAAVHTEALAAEADGAAACRLRTALMGPYGAVGDSYFWRGLRPCVVLMALLLAVVGYAWAPWLLLGLFGGLNLLARALFFVLGVHRGAGVVEAVQRLALLRQAETLKAAAALLAGAFVVAAVPEPRWAALGIPPVMGWTGLVGVALVGAQLVRRGVGPGTLVAAVATAACVAAWLSS